MGLRFRQAPEVRAGSCRTSDQAVCMAHAFNDRILSGIGDFTWRLHQYFLNAARQIRKPDNLGNFPPQHELFSFYSLIDENGATWPVQTFDGPEGINPAAVLGAFLAGRDGVGNEYTRTLPVTDPFVALPTTDAEKWEFAKNQRGGYSDTDGVLDSPAFEAAQSVFSFQFGFDDPLHQIKDDSGTPTPIGLSARDGALNPHGASYGGYFPEPTRITIDGFDTCDGTELGRVNFEIKFTRLSDGAETTFPGTCPPGTLNGAANHVEAVYEGPFEYIAVEFGGTLHRFPKSEYIQGPYTGWGRPQKDQGRQLERMQNLFLHDFAGTAAQRAAEPTDASGRTINFDRFLSSQYRVAPAYATWSDPTLTPIYPEFSTTTTTPGTKLDCDQGGTSWATHDGYGLGGYYVTFTGPVSPVLALKVNGQTIETITGDALVYWDQLHKGTIEIEVVSGSFTDVTIEIAELWEYQPQHWDTYLAMRLATTEGNALDNVDGDPREWDPSAWLADYLDEGWLKMRALSVVDEDTTPTNSPVYQALRRFILERMRWIRRTEFTRYEFDGDDSILYFERNVPGAGDAWEGIAPPTTTVSSGAIEVGVVYQVRATGGDYVTYNGANYLHEDTFTGVEGVATYAVSGSPDLRQYEGLRKDASVNEWSNEWVLHIDTKAYATAESNTFKIETYTDHFGQVDRCGLFGRGTSAMFRAITNDATYTAPNLGLVAPEMPSGYRYADELGDTGYARGAAGYTSTDIQNFAKACPIYRRPYYLRSVTSFNDGGTEYVKVRVQGRIQHDETAPGKIEQTTSKDWLDDIEYRTDENALCEYERYPGTDCKNVKGDVHHSDNNNHQPVEGSCVPTFHLTKLIEKPYVDDNDIDDASDTHATAHWIGTLEWYLRVMCEGWVDSKTTEANGLCDSGAPFGASEVYDFRFETLINQTSPGATYVPPGFGPLPGQQPLASRWNIIARAVNALTRARVPIPSSLQIRRTIYQSSQPVSSLQESAGTCGDTGRVLAFRKGYPLIGSNLQRQEDWENFGTTPFTAEAEFGIRDTNCQAGQFELYHDRDPVEFRWDPTDADLTPAIHPDILALLQTNAVVAAEVYERKHTPDIRRVNDSTDADFSISGRHYKDIHRDNPQINSTSCRVVSSGELIPIVSSADLAFWRDGVGQESKQIVAHHRYTLDTNTESGLTPIIEVPVDTCLETPLAEIEEIIHLNPPWLGIGAEFDWEDVEGAEAYEVQIYTGGILRGEYEVLDSGFVYTLERIEADGAKSRTLEIRVRPKNSTRVGAWRSKTITNEAPRFDLFELDGIITDSQIGINLNQTGADTWRTHLSTSDGFTPSSTTARFQFLDTGTINADYRNLAPNTTYFLRAELRDDWDLVNGTSTLSAQLSATTSGSVVVGDLTGLTDDGWFGDEVVFSWDAASGATSYDYDIQDDTGASVRSGNTASTSLTYTTANIAADGGPWRNGAIEVTPKDGSSNTGRSGFHEFTNAKPSPVSGLTGSDQGSGTVRVSWTSANPGDLSEHRVHYSESPGVTTASSHVAGGSSPIDISGVTAGATLYFRVQTRDTYVGDDYPITDELSVSTALAPLATPTGLNHGDWNGDRVSMTWDAVATADGYEVDLRPNGGAVVASYRTISPQFVALSVEIANVGANVRSLQLDVRATRSAERSGTASLTVTNTKPETPANLTSSSVTDGAVTISWDPSADTDFRRDRIYYAEAPGVTTSSPFVDSGSASITITDLTPGGTLYYKVERRDEFVTDWPITTEQSQAIQGAAALGAVTGLRWVGLWTGRTGRLEWNAVPGAVDYVVRVKLSSVTVREYRTTEPAMIYTTERIITDGLQVRSGASFEVFACAGGLTGAADTLAVSNTSAVEGVGPTVITKTPYSFVLDFPDATDSDGDVTGYFVGVGINPSGPFTFRQVLAVASEATIPGLAPNTLYWVRVEYRDSFAHSHTVGAPFEIRTLAATDSGGSSSSSSSLPTTPPPTGTLDLAITNLADNPLIYAEGDWDGFGIELSWDAAVDAVTYDVEAWPDGWQTPAKIWDAATNAFTLSQSDLEAVGGPWRKLQWRVRARAGAQTGNTLTLDLDNPAVDLPTSISAQRNGSFMTINWAPNPVDTNWDKVKIWVSPDSNFSPDTLAPTVDGVFSNGVAFDPFDATRPLYWLAQFTDEFHGSHAQTPRFIAYP